jgi:hypothetical protein
MQGSIGVSWIHDWLVCILSLMPKAAMQSTCLEGYCAAVADLDCHHFGNDACGLVLSSSSVKKMGPMSADSLHHYFQDSCTSTE